MLLAVAIFMIVVRPEMPCPVTVIPTAKLRLGRAEGEDSCIAVLSVSADTVAETYARSGQIRELIDIIARPRIPEVSHLGGVGIRGRGDNEVGVSRRQIGD